MDYSSNLSKGKKQIISIIAGLLGLLLSPFCIEAEVGEIYISLPWSLIFPISVAMAFGGWYGLLAGIFGGAYYPFVLWWDNGIPNFATGAVHLLVFFVLGYWQANFTFVRLKSRFYHLLLILGGVFLVYFVYYEFIFNYLLSLNPEYWPDAKIKYLPVDVMHSFLFKESINLLVLVLLVLTFFQIAQVRKFFGMDYIPATQANGLVFILCIFISLLVWLVFIGLGKSLLTGQLALKGAQISLALMVVLMSGIIVARILFYYRMNHFTIRNELKRAQKTAKAGNWTWFIPENRVWWSDEMFRIFEIDRKGFSGDLNEIISQAIHPDDRKRIEESNLSVIKKNKPVPVEYRIVCKNGLIKHVLGLADDLIVDKNGNAKMLTGIVKDITDQKLIQHELEIAKARAEESDRLKTAFLQNLSHEIRTPMNAINGFSAMLEKPGISEEKRRSFTTIIRNSSNQLLSIVSDILTISSLETHQETVNTTKVNINNLLVELLTVFKQQAFNQNISIYAKQSLQENQTEIYTDKTKLTQILTNLLTNALKFTHEGFIEFGYKITEPEILFYVKDTGIGIAPEHHEKIFDRFRQADLTISTNYGGSGLGLAISKAFTELLGGRIWVESEPGKGSGFFFTIPYLPANELEISKVNQVIVGNRKTILVAEDEEYNFLYLEELLMALNANVLHAKNGEEAVHLVNKNPDIYLVLMDIKMPVMDGYSAAMLIREKHPGLTIIAQSAYALEHEIKKYKEIFDDYIVKPIEEKEFTAKIKNWIELV